MTDKRESLLRILSEEERYMAAKEVYQLMREEYPSISLDTIYRNLKTFTELNILEEVDYDNESIYRFCCDNHHHHHHFICENCGRTRELECPVNYFQSQIPGYEVRDHRFEVFGLCEDCVKLKNS